MSQLRIVAGQWRGRRIDVPNDWRVRPTADRVREAWLSIVQHDIPGSRALDLFAGSGALGLEALSRGASHADFVESSVSGLAALRKNLESLGATSWATVHRGDAIRFAQSLGAAAYDIAFADPPYRMGHATALAERWIEVPFARVIGIEHESSVTLPDPRDVATASKDPRKYGDTTITFYRLA